MSGCGLPFAAISEHHQTEHLTIGSKFLFYACGVMTLEVNASFCASSEKLGLTRLGCFVEVYKEGLAGGCLVLHSLTLLYNVRFRSQICYCPNRSHVFLDASHFQVNCQWSVIACC